MDQRLSTMEQKISTMEDPAGRVGDENTIPAKHQQMQEDQNTGRAEATGFHDDTTEQEVEQLLKDAITEIGMSVEGVKIKYPVKPITHTLIQFSDNEEMNNMSDLRTG